MKKPKHYFVIHDHKFVKSELPLEVEQVTALDPNTFDLIYRAIEGHFGSMLKTINDDQP